MEEPTQEDLQDLLKNIERENLFSIICFPNETVEIKFNYDEDPKLIASSLKKIINSSKELIAAQLLKDMSRGKISQDFIMDFSEEWKASMPCVRASQVSL